MSKNSEKQQQKAKTGLYYYKEDENRIVRAIYYTSFEDEIVILEKGKYVCTKVDVFLQDWIYIVKK